MSSSFDRLKRIVARLRSPDGCPWDREQTHESLKPHLLEECYEVIDSIDSKNDSELKEELGDILLQVVLHSQIAAENSRFDFEEVASLIADKLVHRHPHVFGNYRLPDSEAVLQQWDSLKRLEKSHRESILDGVPKALPALARAQKLQTKAGRVGFDWDDAEGAWRKVLEEVNEVAAAANENRAEEIGDLLFAIVNFARKNKLDAEQILNRATKKFYDRFRKMERLASECEMEFVNLSLDEMEQLWIEAKK
ncbi:MAG: nucleoside triphosphate pyrophosphohydrolase [Verrucomicrobia bacterium]|nr:nucleoside triphosphate pyrophosphohydrolase [Verrucomicrobiota bacterium]